MFQKKIAVAAVAAAALLSLGSVTAFAAENYSYLAGQASSKSRTAAYAQAENPSAVPEVLPVSPVSAEPETAPAPAGEETAAYSYVAGRQRSQSRGDVYAQAEAIESEADREAFLNAQGIGETEWSEEAAASYSYVAGQQRGSSYHQ